MKEQRKPELAWTTADSIALVLLLACHVAILVAIVSAGGCL